MGFAQSIGVHPYIEGYVYDAEKKEPIPFATIKVKGWAKGVITNRNGSFKVPGKFAQFNDTLVVSSMGYDTKVVSLQQMMIKELNVVFLEPHVYGLDEAVVYGEKKKKLSARAIVRKAIRSIPENYPDQPFSLTGYYRDYQWHGNDYLNLNEAILSIYDQGFENKDGQSTAFALHHIVRNDNFPRDSISSEPYDYKTGNKIINMARLDAYGGNELRILRVHDAIRNYEVSSYAFVYKLKSQFLYHHRFKREGDIFLDDESFYHITFKKSQNGYAAFGYLIVDKRNFSIYKFYYSLFYDDTNAKSNADARTKKELIFEVVSEYRPFNNQMYLDYITFNNRFLLPELPRFYIEHLIVNPGTQTLSLKFNNPFDKEKATIISNYGLTFFGEPLPIKKVFMDVRNPNTILTIPSFQSRKKERDFYTYFRNYKGNKEAGKKLQCLVKNIRDTEGNLVNKIYDYEEYQQFREFFTQEVQQDFEVPPQAFLMNMKATVFEGQPLMEKVNLENYWMNTPLKVIDN